MDNIQTLSIITINYNNLEGLRKTLESVFNQTSRLFEYIVVDGGSTDGSKELLEQFSGENAGFSFHWVSERDHGIYNAMNKGILMSKGKYLQFLNSGDLLVGTDVISEMLNGMPEGCAIYYGNMLKQYPDRVMRDKGFAGRQPTMLDFYRGTLNHSPAMIRRELFERYGLYDECLKIVSDWKWYLQVIVFGGEKIVYKDLDVTLFDMGGISSTNTSLDKSERRQVLSTLLPEKVLEDYQGWSFPIAQLQRIKHYGMIYRMFYLLDRLIFRIERKKLIKRNKVTG